MQRCAKTHPYIIMFFISSILYETASAQWTAVPFLLVPPSARVTAMGESGVAFADDASASFLNPAGLGFQKGQEVNLTYTSWLPQIRLPWAWSDNMVYGAGNYRICIPKIGGSFATSIVYLYSGYIYSVGGGDSRIPLSSDEYAISVSYGSNLINDFSVGFGIRYTHSTLVPKWTEQEAGTGTASAISGDIGILYRPSHIVIPFTQIDLEKRFGIGLALTNMGPSFYYIDEAQAYPLPTNL